MNGLLSVGEADRRIDAHTPLFGSERVALDAAAGRVLRQDVQAERDQPPFDRVMMDGIAIVTDAGVARVFAAGGLALAGMDEQLLDDPGACIEVTTGAMLPRGCNCVVPVEQIRREGERFALLDDCHPAPGQFIHRRGSDCRQGDILLRAGMRIRAPEMAVLAANGMAEVDVARTPSVTIVATGDELKEVDQPLAPGQIRRSNDRALAAALAARGFDNVELSWIPDDLNAVTQTLEQLLATRQVLVLSGGVSVGQRDYVPAALQALGVREVLHRIAQRPGKPMWFGIGPQQQLVFALPGNPVSVLVCAVRYMLPALERAIGLTAASPERVVLGTEAARHPTLTCFIPVVVHHDESGRAMAQPLPSRTSGDFSLLPQTHGVVELAPGEGAAAAGTVAILHRW